MGCIFKFVCKGVILRKKLHILLADYVINQVDYGNLITHTAIFKFGSLLPDLVPSFITKRHEIGVTFEIVRRKIENVISSLSTGSLSVKCSKDLGVITHYLSDYFTFPHNTVYDGSMKDHVLYERDLKFEFSDYVSTCGSYTDDNLLTSVDEICNYIKCCHTHYLHMARRSVAIDCDYIVRVCRKFMASIIALVKTTSDCAFV